jgi:hypothetical protein
MRPYSMIAAASCSISCRPYGYAVGASPKILVFRCPMLCRTYLRFISAPQGEYAWIQNWIVPSRMRLYNLGGNGTSPPFVEDRRACEVVVLRGLPRPRRLKGLLAAAARDAPLCCFSHSTLRTKCIVATRK